MSTFVKQIINSKLLFPITELYILAISDLSIQLSQKSCYCSLSPQGRRSQTDPSIACSYAWLSGSNSKGRLLTALGAILE